MSMMMMVTMTMSLRRSEKRPVAAAAVGTRMVTADGVDAGAGVGDDVQEE